MSSELSLDLDQVLDINQDIDLIIHTPNASTPISSISTAEPPVFKYYGDGSFDFISRTHMRDMLVNAHWAVSSCELWGWIRAFNQMSFMLSNSPELHRISKKMGEQPIGQLHSGASFGLTLRVMEYIAKNGYDKYREHYLSGH